MCYIKYRLLPNNYWFSHQSGGRLGRLKSNSLDFGTCSVVDRSTLKLIFRLKKKHTAQSIFRLTTKSIPIFFFTTCSWHFHDNHFSSTPIFPLSRRCGPGLELVEFMSVEDTARLLLPFSSRVSTLVTSSATISLWPRVVISAALGTT